MYVETSLSDADVSWLNLSVQNFWNLMSWHHLNHSHQGPLGKPCQLNMQTLIWTPFDFDFGYMYTIETHICIFTYNNNMCIYIYIHTYIHCMCMCMAYAWSVLANHLIILQSTNQNIGSRGKKKKNTHRQLLPVLAPCKGKGSSVFSEKTIQSEHCGCCSPASSHKHVARLRVNQSRPGCPSEGVSKKGIFTRQNCIIGMAGACFLDKPMYDT